MTLLNQGQQGVNNITQKIKNPFSKAVENTIRDQDFTEGFIFQELTGPKTKVQLNGNLMPHVPFIYGGEQRVAKDYYPGQTEPAVHILGPQESDVEITGRFYDKQYERGTGLYGVATEISELCDSLRIRGNLLLIRMGEWQRYGFLKMTQFDMKNIGDISYKLTFDIVGFNAPINGKFVEKKRQIPFDINENLIGIANTFQNDIGQIPLTVPVSIAGKIQDLTNTVATAINLVTDLVDTVISTTNDIQKATQRALGLIKHTQNKMDEYKRFFGGLDPFDPNQSLTGRYENASYYANRISFASFTTSFLQRYRRQFLNLIETLPLGRHLTKENDSLQKLSVRYYGDASKWKNIYDHNKLESTDLDSGVLLEIPRL